MKFKFIEFIKGIRKGHLFSRFVVVDILIPLFLFIHGHLLKAIILVIIIGLSNYYVYITKIKPKRAIHENI